MPKISVLILTLNEEANLADCLASCSWCDDVVVFDSFSSDRTATIAETHGARVVTRTFDNYAAQRNAALHGVAYRHPWVLMLDADERIPDDLAREIQDVTEYAAPDTVMFRMRRKDFFFGRWLKRSSGYPTWFGRLVRPDRVRVERDINEEYVADGNIEALHCHLHHYPFNKGIAWWFERHNRYSTLEATTLQRERSQPVLWRQLFGNEPIARRRQLKRLLYRMPLRPVLMFGYLYFIRCGFLDGAAGLNYSTMRASYELMIDTKIKELQYRKQQKPV